jgi:2-octaprenyl-6-methoxyphenol hydroxylase
MRYIMTTIEADILIIGGGLVGGTLGCILADQGMSVVLVDREAPSDQMTPEYDGRASAIALGTQRVLEGAGLWDDLKDDSAPIDDIRVTDGDSLMFLHYDHNDMDIRPFGYMVENRRLRVALARRFGSLKKLNVLALDSIRNLDRDAGGVTATLESGKTISAKLAIGADGRSSQTREDAGIELTQWSYNQSGIVCTVEHEQSHENIAHERFLPAGPFAILPLTGNRSCIVWTERSELAPAMMALGDDEFNAELARRFGDFLGKTRPTGPRWCYPLSLQFAERVLDKRLVLVGDAAHAMHPIAGQGLNMGLRDVAAMAEVLSDAHRLGLDLGSAAVLERYERWRRFDNTLMLCMTDLLNRLFSNDIAPIRLARDLGLAVVNRIPLLKRFFMRHAMGLVGDLPRLMRGEKLG